MKIRRYIGSNTQEAILKVKMDLGNEALILNTRKVRQKGLFKIFSKPMVEVLAAIDDNYDAKKDRVNSKPEEKANAGELNENIAPQKDSERILELEDKLNYIETLVQRIYEQSKLSRSMNASNAKDGQDKQDNVTRVLQLFYSNLIKNEVETHIAKKIIEAAAEKLGKHADVNGTASVLCNIIAGLFGKPETIKLKENGKPTVAIFLGPTGVGKTTTLAKIAANFSLNHNKAVGLITADTYRIAAVEQLKTYAEILGLPLTVIYSPNEIEEAINQHSDKDIILVDTAGRSCKNKQQFDELKALVAAAQADEIYLVLSATTSAINTRRIIEHYSFLKNFKLLFTKIDEASAMGTLLNTRYLTGKSLSYITTGQSVPDDIEVANTDKLAKNLLGNWGV